MLIGNVAICQIDHVFTVTAESLNVRQGPSSEHPIIHSLKMGREVVVVSDENPSWYLVDLGFTQGYVSSKYLTKDPDWIKKHYSNGTAPNCENVQPLYDRALDNYLRINVGSNTDVVVKLVKKGYGGDKCIRLAYVRASESYDIKFIPEGVYYLKLAYGKDWRQKVVSGKCIGKFLKSALYEKGDDILDYNKEHTSTGHYLPSYELSLEVVEAQFFNEFESDEITEEEFNE